MCVPPRSVDRLNRAAARPGRAPTITMRLPQSTTVLSSDKLLPFNGDAGTRTVDDEVLKSKYLVTAAKCFCRLADRSLSRIACSCSPPPLFPLSLSPPPLLPPPPPPTNVD